MHCSFAANRVDSEDQQTGKSGNTLPVFTDKIWAAALKAHGTTLSESPDLTRPCIDVLPFVVSFCAAEYTCMDTDSIDGFFSPNDLQVAREKAAKTVAPLKKHTIPIKKSLSQEEMTSFDQQWEALVTSKFHDLDAESDAFQWTLLWQMANVSHKVGLMSSWPEILEALYGTRKIDWTNTRLYWEKVLFTAHLRLQLRELKSNGPTAMRPVQDERSLNNVVLNLQSIYETKLCSPGALGGLKDENLERLGVEDSATLALHSLDKDDVVKGMWRNWMVLHVKKTWSSSAMNRFLRLLDDRGCSCMCYEALHEQQPTKTSPL